MEYGDIDNFNHSGDTMESADDTMAAFYRAKREGRLTSQTVETVATEATVEAEKVIVIQETPRGSYDFTPPFKHDAFLADFEKNIGKTFRCWNTFKNCWQVRPVDMGMIDLIAVILRRHFKGFDVVVKMNA